jgi:hypothetical protein
MLVNRLFRSFVFPTVSGVQVDNVGIQTFIVATSSTPGQPPIGQSYLYNLQQSTDNTNWSDVSGYTNLGAPSINLTSIRTIGNYYRFQGYLGSSVILTTSSVRLVDYTVADWVESVNNQSNLTNGSANTIDVVILGPGGAGGAQNNPNSGGGGGGGGAAELTYVYTPGEEFNFVLTANETRFSLAATAFTDYVEAVRGGDAAFITPGAGGSSGSAGIFSPLSPTYGTLYSGNSGAAGTSSVPVGFAFGGNGGAPGILPNSSSYPFAGYGEGGQGFNAGNGIPFGTQSGFYKYRFRQTL